MSDRLPVERVVQRGGLAESSAGSTAPVGIERSPLATHDIVNDRTRTILEHRAKSILPSQRGWLLHRTLVLADLFGLLLAFVASSWLTSASGNAVSSNAEALLVCLSLPLWIVLMKLEGLYDRDEERTDHSTVDDIAAVFKVVTHRGLALLRRGAGDRRIRASRSTGSSSSGSSRSSRSRPAVRLSRGTLCRRSIAYVQNAVIVGAGHVGQQLAAEAARAIRSTASTSSASSTIARSSSTTSSRSGFRCSAGRGPATRSSSSSTSSA